MIFACKLKNFKALDMNGQWNVIWFAVIVFAGAFYLVNLTFPVVALAYYEEVRIAALVCIEFFFSTQK